MLILVLPTVELYDDYMNYPNTSYWAMFSLIFLRWVPQMGIFFIDTSIWFACWSAMAGTVVGFQVGASLRGGRGLGGGGEGDTSAPAGCKTPRLAARDLSSIVCRSTCCCVESPGLCRPVSEAAGLGSPDAPRVSR